MGPEQQYKHSSIQEEFELLSRKSMPLKSMSWAFEGPDDGEPKIPSVDELAKNLE